MRPRRATSAPRGRRAGMPDDHDEPVPDTLPMGSERNDPPDTQPLVIGEPAEFTEEDRIEVLLEWAPVVGFA